MTLGTLETSYNSIVFPFHLKYIGQDKENDIDLLLSSHCKQTDDPGEGQQRNNDDVGHQQIPVNVVHTYVQCMYL